MCAGSLLLPRAATMARLRGCPRSLRHAGSLLLSSHLLLPRSCCTHIHPVIPPRYICCHTSTCQAFALSQPTMSRRFHGPPPMRLQAAVGHLGRSGRCALSRPAA
ncbi:hypothetical protein ZWY2020_038184 [Hordeum vulgare]|nr:hypothetical protein ZWY2020_038184 [Hordeum vulgare]